jgi:C-methyltransferase-like protein
VPDLNDFVAGFEMVLAPEGVVTIEVPHLMRLVEDNQFDTIYHEHFQYFSFLSAQRVLAGHGLEVFDVDELKSHGGSLRYYAQRKSTGTRPIEQRVHDLVARERALGFDTLDAHLAFTAQVEETKWSLLEFLIAKRREGRRIAGYGAPGKGNTLLNYCGIRTDLLDYTVDRNPYKQGQFLPGTHIPIRHPEVLEQDRPDYILILPWNLKEEIVAQLAYAREWGARFIVPIPQVEVL